MAIHIIFFPLVNQAAQQTLSMVFYVRRSVPEGRVGVVSKRHYPSIRHVLWKEVFEPEGIGLAMRPRILLVLEETMDRDDTE